MPQLPEKVRIRVVSADAEYDVVLDTIEPIANPADRDDDTQYAVSGRMELVADHTPEGMQKRFEKTGGLPLQRPAAIEEKQKDALDDGVSMDF